MSSFALDRLLEADKVSTDAVFFFLARLELQCIVQHWWVTIATTLRTLPSPPPRRTLDLQWMTMMMMVHRLWQ